MSRVTIPTVQNLFAASTRAFTSGDGWTQNNITGWAIGPTSPLGGNMQGMIANTTNGTHWASRTFSGLVAGQRYTFGILAKAGAVNFLSLQDGTGNQAWFNLATGAIGTFFPSPPKTQFRIRTTSIAAVYLCELSFTYAGTGSPQVRYQAADTDADDTFAGDATNASIYIDGAQLASGSNQVGPYVDGPVDTGPLRSIP